MWITIGCIVWYVLGWLGFIYWWTSEHDYTQDELFISFIIALFGPPTLIIGFFIHGLKNRDKVVLKRRV